MPVHNSDVSRILREVADLLEIEGASQYRVRAYRNAARTIETLSRNVADMVRDGEDLTELSGIGESIAEKIQEIVKTGSLEQLQEIEHRTPPELAKMLEIEGLGPKRVQKIYEALHVTSTEDLRKKAQAGKIRELEGFGAKTEKKILQELERRQHEQERTRRDVAEEIVEPLVAYLHEIEGVQQVKVAGSYRRRQETVGDLDILATGANGKEIINRFVEFEDVEEVISQGGTRSTVKLRNSLQTDLRVVAEESYGAALLYFTGSKAHNIKLRNMALDRDLKLNEYGVFRGDERIAGQTEEEIYDLLDLVYIPPELREDRGEIEAAQQDTLPKLVTLEDIRGDLQMHTKASDGQNSAREMAQAAAERGYEYVAITDHSSYIGVTQGLDADALAKRIDVLKELDEELKEITVLTGIEVDILEDGSLDLPDDVLEKVDVCIFAIHSKFGLSVDKQTARILRAMDNPNVHILAHPSGREINRRPAYDVDWERLFEAAVERGCFMEINAQPSRLDLNDIHAQMAKEMGLKLAISTDAHSVAELDYIRYGLDQARRGWLEAGDVLNTRRWADLHKLLKR